MASVEIQSIRKSFGSTEVIHGVDVEIEDGEFVVLVGPSGCGKSTLLRMIAGLEGITEGRISIGGRVVNHLPPSQRDIAMVFQNYALYPHKTVASNMALALRMQRVEKAEIKRRVEQASEILGLTRILTGIRAPCRAASGSGSLWGAPLSGILKFSCSTSPCPTLTPSCGSRCGPRFESSTRGSRLRLST